MGADADPGNGGAPKRRGPGRPRLTEPSPEYVARRKEIVATAGEPRYDEEIRGRERRYFEAYRSAVEAAIDAGALPDIDPRYATQAILGMGIWPYKWFRPERDDIGDLTDACVELVLGRRAGRARRAPNRRQKVSGVRAE